MEVCLLLRRVLACLIMCLLNTCQENFFMHIAITEWLEKAYKAFQIAAGIIKRKIPWYVEWSCVFRKILKIFYFFQCVKAAELIGTFVNPKVSLKLITSAFEKTPKPSCIMVLTAVIRGSPKEILQPHLTDLGNKLSQAGVCQRSEEVRMIGKYTTVPSFRLVVLQTFNLFSLSAPFSLLHPPYPIIVVVGMYLRQRQELPCPPWATMYSFPSCGHLVKYTMPKNLLVIHPYSRCGFRFENCSKMLQVVVGKGMTKTEEAG